MSDPAPAAPAPKTKRKPGPKATSPYTAIARVAAEFSALAIVPGSGLHLTAMGLIETQTDLTDLATAAADLDDEQRTIAVAMCEAMLKGRKE